MGYELVLFDFDYTLADSSLGIVTCFQHVLKRNGYTEVTDEAIKRTIGKTLEDSFAILTGVTAAEVLAEWKREYVRAADTHMTVNTVLYDDTLEVLKTLKAQGIRVGIISTKYRYRILEFFERYFSSDWFDVVVGGEDVTQHKPHPEGVLMALSKMNASPNGTLYIGDSVVDAEVAENAGLHFVGVTTGMTTRKELEVYAHKAVIDRLSSLLQMV